MTLPTMMGLETALRGLEVNQEAIDTTGHNIANANTPGYSRQVVDETESTPLSIPAESNVDGAGVQVGTGVDATTISRVRDQFLDVQYRAQNSSTSYTTNQSTVLNQIQTGLAEPSANGLSNALSNFWSSWSTLANGDPTSTAARQAVVDSGTTLAETFNTIGQQLSTEQSQASQQYSDLIAPNGQVQSDATQVASLNTSIAAAQAAGQNANDLMDQRDNLLDDLSSLAKTSVTTQANGMVTVNFGDAATPLISGTTVTWPQTLTSAAGGELGSLLSLSSANGQIANYETQLNSVANTLVNAVNGLQPTSPFFSGTTASGPTGIAVVATAGSLQTSTTANAGAADLATQIAALSGGATDQQYQSFVAQVGSDAQSAQNGQTTAQSLLSAIGNQRQSVSGVSLDEEMTNLVNFQQAYEASARVMTTMQQVLNTLIENTGTSGL